MNTKPWFQSKTIWGSVVAFVAMALKAFGVDINADSPQLVDGILNVVSFAGTILAIYGRVRANSIIAPAPKDPPPVNLNFPLLIAGICLLTAGLSGCAEKQTAPASTSSVAKVGTDLATDFATAIKAFEDYRAGNVDLTQSLANGAVAYQAIITGEDDVKQLWRDWVGNSSDSQKWSDKIARIFAASEKPPAEKAAALALAAQTVAASP